jgi:mannose-6-phosphate isomerase-like protein (cupin superfamily)
MTAELKAGVSYARPAGVEHNVVNGSSMPLAFVEVELKHLPG